MRTYLVVLNDSSEEETILNNLKQNLPECDIHKHSDNVFFLSVKEFIYINELAKRIGFSSKENIKGFVTKISSIQGMESADLWDWLEKDD